MIELIGTDIVVDFYGSIIQTKSNTETVNRYEQYTLYLR